MHLMKKKAISKTYFLVVSALQCQQAHLLCVPNDTPSKMPMSESLLLANSNLDIIVDNSFLPIIT